MIIGITGGSGSGKTTALRVLEKHKALILDCDRIYHELLNRSDAMLAEIEERFPEAFENGKFQRKKLGKLVFGDSSALTELNAITHKYVSREIDKAIYSLSANKNSIVGIDAIALIESGISKKCDVVVGILAPKQARIERIMKREGINKEYAVSRVDSQKSDDFYVENCNYILRNHGSTQVFTKACDNLFSQIIKEGKNG